jgi:hypothetical protein
MSDNYEDLLDKSFDEIPEPQVLPVGSWRLEGRNATFQAPKEAGKSATVLFVYKAKEPMDDVDEDELAKLGEDYDYGLKPIFVRIWLESGADFDKVRKHLKNHGISLEGGKSIKDILKEDFRGTEVIASLDKRSFVNGVGEEQEENTATMFVPAE